ncbi:MAG: metal-dependent transcriptional regulator [candidate division KSB1 bacterium]|nr:metal-dependent transcriptional regulator [candidate division KSB1 bacterium]
MEKQYDVTTQEYIEVIYQLEKENRVARVTEIAERRGVTKSSVSLVMQQLQQKNLVDRKLYGHITLTAGGRRLGAKLMKRHEVLARFLQDVVGVSPQTAEQDACILEHVISNESLNAMRRLLEGVKGSPEAEGLLAAWREMGDRASRMREAKSAKERRDE